MILRGHGNCALASWAWRTIVVVAVISLAFKFPLHIHTHPPILDANMATLMFQSGGAGRGQDNDPPGGRKPPPKGHYRENQGVPPKALLAAWKRAGVGKGFPCCITCLQVKDEKHRAAWLDCSECATHGNSHVGAPCPELLTLNDMFWRKHMGQAKYEVTGQAPAPSRRMRRQANAQHANSQQVGGWSGPHPQHAGTAGQQDAMAEVEGFLVIQQALAALRGDEGPFLARPSTSTPFDDRRMSNRNPRGRGRNRFVAPPRRESRRGLGLYQSYRTNASGANRAANTSEPATATKSADVETRIADLEAQLAALREQLNARLPNSAALDDPDGAFLSGDGLSNEVKVKEEEFDDFQGLSGFADAGPAFPPFPGRGFGAAPMEAGNLPPVTNAAGVDPAVALMDADTDHTNAGNGTTPLVGPADTPANFDELLTLGYPTEGFDSKKG
jgi:hypothetical protein